jgi:hypothetical protein
MSLKPVVVRVQGPIVKYLNVKNSNENDTSIVMRRLLFTAKTFNYPRTFLFIRKQRFAPYFHTAMNFGAPNHGQRNSFA